MGRIERPTAVYRTTDRPLAVVRRVARVGLCTVAPECEVELLTINNSRAADH